MRTIAQCLTVGILGGVLLQPSFTRAGEPLDVAELYKAAGICYILSLDGRARVIEKTTAGAKPVLFKADDEVFCESESFTIIRYLKTKATFRVNHPGWQPVGNPGPANGGPGPNDPARLGRQTSIDPQVPLKTATMVVLAQAGEIRTEAWWYRDLFAYAPMPLIAQITGGDEWETRRFEAYLGPYEWAYTRNGPGTFVARHYGGFDEEPFENGRGVSSYPREAVYKKPKF
ncbi:hypothetical protein KNO81_31355 [Paraburkholderia sediminicola]|nr:hypothetical protein [Paraburkholderia sediminicola]